MNKTTEIYELRFKKDGTLAFSTTSWKEARAWMDAYNPTKSDETCLLSLERKEC